VNPSRSLALVALDGDERAWDRFAIGAEGSSFCHLSGWREILGDVLGAECLYWGAAAENGTWHGILPLVRVRSRIFGHYLVSLPFLNAGGPIGSAAACDLLVTEAVDEARRTGADLLELRTRQQRGLELPVSARKVTVHLHLPPDADALFESFPAKLRSQIRRPMKEGLTVRFGNEQWEPFYEVFARTMRDLGTPVLPRAFFERIAATFPEFVEFGVVYRGEQPLASGCGFAWREEFEMTWAGSIRASRPISANMLLYWAFMQRAIQRNVRVFDFGRCTPGSGTHRFKRQWGGVDVRLPWGQWSANGVRATPSPERPVYRAATAVWRRLPLAMVNRLGPLLARRLP
jgi:serine/alanine adding enzyme